MYGVARRHSLVALRWLRLILWIGVITILSVQARQLLDGSFRFDADIHAMVSLELMAIPLAIYWSRPVYAA